MKYRTKRLAAAILTFGISASVLSAALQVDRPEPDANSVLTSDLTPYGNDSACFALLDAILAADWRATRYVFECMRGLLQLSTNQEVGSSNLSGRAN